MFKLSAVAIAALTATVLPSLADQVLMLEPRPIFQTRDSDGIVISVLDLVDIYPQLGSTGGVVPGGVFYTLGGPLNTSTLGDGGVPVPVSSLGDVSSLGGVSSLGDVSSVGGVSSLGGQPVFLGGPELVAAAAQGAVMEIGGVVYQVEASGDQIWLRDAATGLRHVATRHVAPMSPDAQGLAVNPAQFALD